MSRKRVHGHNINQKNISPPKRQLTRLSISSPVDVRRQTLLQLPLCVLEHILLLCDIPTLGRLGLVSKNFRDLVLEWLKKDISLSTVFPALITEGAELSIVKCKVLGSSKLNEFDPKLARKNFCEVC